MSTVAELLLKEKIIPLVNSKTKKNRAWHLLIFISVPLGAFSPLFCRLYLREKKSTHTLIQQPVIPALEGFTNHSPTGIHHSCPDMTVRSVTATLLHISAPIRHRSHTSAHSPIMWRIYFYPASLEVSLCVIIPAALPLRPWVAHADRTNQGWSVCFYARVWGGDLRSLITLRWILITVWWDTEHQSQSTNALAVNHFNEYILFWPFSELCFFHIPFSLITLYLFLTFSKFTHYPLTHFLILSRSFSPLPPHPQLFFPLFSLYLFTFSLLILLSPTPHLQFKSKSTLQLWSYCASTQSCPRFWG